jgi:undecaprenyl-diphosphatase
MTAHPKRRGAAVIRAFDGTPLLEETERGPGGGWNDPPSDGEPSARLDLYAAAVGGLLFAGVIAFRYDRELALYFFGYDQAPAVRFARLLTNLGLAELYILVTLFAFSVCRAARQLRQWSDYPVYVFMCVTASGLAADLLKIAVGRSRPDLLFSRGEYGHVLWRFGHDVNSFPSGHATTLGAVAAALSLLFPRYQGVWWVLGAALAATRFVTAVHYLSDTLVGFALGIACAVAIREFLLRRGWRL